MHVLQLQVNFKFMPKVFIPKIPPMSLGPMPNKMPDIYGGIDDKYWSARKSLSFTLKKYFYFKYVASFKVSATTSGYYKHPPQDIGDYCKNIVEVTASSVFTVTKTISDKENSAQQSNPPLNTFPPSIHELMCGYTTNNWHGKVKQKYRRTNSSYPYGAQNVENQTEKKRNCYKDYDDDGNKISENPDTSIWDYTVYFDSSLILYINGYGGSGGNFLDDTNFTVQPAIYFGGVYNHMGWPSDYEPDCALMKSSGTLIFVGINVPSVVRSLGTACSYEGNINMQENWSASSKLKLVNN